MFGIFTNIARWLFSKTAMLLVLWVVVLGVVAAYLASQRYLEKLPDQLREKQAQVEAYREQLTELDGKVVAIEAKIRQQIESLDAKRQAFEADLARRKNEMTVWRDKLNQLLGMKGRALEIWNKLRGIDSKFEISALETRMAEARRENADLRQQITAAHSEKISLTKTANSHTGGLKEEQADLADSLKSAEEDLADTQSEVDRWQGRMGKGKDFLQAAYAKVGRPLILVSLSIIILPLVGKVLLFHFWAPLISVGRSVMIRTDAKEPVSVSETAVAQEVVLQPGQIATIQHKFFQASDEDLSKRTKWVFSWRYPFSCLACGLFLLTRVTNQSKHQRRLTLSSQHEAEIEMAVVDVPKDGALICRPSFLAALIQESTDRPSIRSHWRFFSMHSWITLQFRYFEFRGPVKLVFWAYRGIRAEHLTEENVQQGNERRTNQLATIGFTPSLHYRSRRSETFISYLRDHNPLFDDLFSGKGVFLCQQISRAEHNRRAGRFWARLWNGLTKIIGI